MTTLYGPSLLPAATIVILLSVPCAAFATDVLQDARVRIAITDPMSCDVTVSIGVALDVGRDVEQRLQRLEGSRVDLLGITGAGQAAPTRSVGLTEVLVIRLPNAGSQRYEVRYRVTQPDEWAYRCPVWLPTIAADGRSRNVSIQVTLPPGARPAGGSFPSFEWEGDIGRAILGHLPAFVRVPYMAPGQASRVPRDLGRMMDIAALAVLIGGTAVWAARRRR
jgi:hypothetical protein